MSNKEKKAIETATETLSAHFMVALPDLLSKVSIHSVVGGSNGIKQKIIPTCKCMVH